MSLIIRLIFGSWVQEQTHISEVNVNNLKKSLGDPFQNKHKTCIMNGTEWWSRCHLLNPLHFDQRFLWAQVGGCSPSNLAYEAWGTETMCVLKEGLCEAGSWLAVEGRVTVRNWVATAAIPLAWCWWEEAAKLTGRIVDRVSLWEQAPAFRLPTWSVQVWWGLQSHKLLQTGVRKTRWVKITLHSLHSLGRWGLVL